MNNNVNVVLIGFMGCGKSSIGNRLAYRMGYSFIDSDKRIEAVAQMSISEIFEKKGETYFRNIETGIIDKIAQIDKQVIATGGGVIKNDENVRNLKKNGVIVYLSATSEHIYENIKDDHSRPLLEVTNRLEKIKSLLSERKALYEKCADITLDVTAKSVDICVDELIKILK